VKFSILNNDLQVTGIESSPYWRQVSSLLCSKTLWYS